MCLRQGNGTAIARCEEFIFTKPAALPDGADRMDDMPCGKPITAGDLRLSRGAAVKRAALREQLRSGRAMYRAVNTAAAKQGFVRRVDDRINAERCDIGNGNLEPCR